jgi:hypothetical protein
MESENAVETTEPMPFLDRLAGFFLSPGEIFDNIARSPIVTSTWFFPWLLYVLISIFAGQLIVGNPSLSSQLEQTLRTQFDEMMHESIVKGNITQGEADEQFERFGTPGSPWFTLISVGGALFGSLATLFAVSLFCLLLGMSAMSTSAPYMKVVEIVGLTFLIDVLERIVTTVMMLMTDSILASPSLALFLLPDVDLENKAHVALSKLNVFTFWKIGMVGLGLARLFRKDFSKVLVLVVSLWILWSLFSLFTGFNPGS